MVPSERRRFRRVGAEFKISFQDVGDKAEQSYTGKAVNVSQGGLYLHTSAELFTTGKIPQGKLFKVEMSIPPTKGLLEFGGKVAGFAKLIRTSDIPDTVGNSRCGLGLEFCQPMKLSI